MMIGIVQMASTYYLNKLRKDCFLKRHGWKDPKSAARARGAICRTVKSIQIPSGCDVIILQAEV